MPKMPWKCRRLRPGEALPQGTPRRYITTDGYIVLRWKLGVNEYIEVLEHRFLAATDDRQIHHLNHDKTDNRLENLRPLTLHDHARHHGSEARRFDRTKAIELYRQGYGTPAIGAMLGVDGSNIFRGLARLGFKGRSRGVATERQRETIARKNREAWAARSPEERKALIAKTVARRHANGTYRLPYKVNRKVEPA